MARLGRKIDDTWRADTCDLAAPILDGAQSFLFNWVHGALQDGELCDDGAITSTDSPIEAQLLVAVGLQFKLYDTIPLKVLKRTSSEDDLPEAGAAIIPQFSIGKYRADFVVLSKEAQNLRLVIECDGHEFHHATKEQVERDKVRDRAIQSRGFHILRFSGREIYRDAMSCAYEVQDFVNNAFYESHYGVQLRTKRKSPANDNDGGESDVCTVLAGTTDSGMPFRTFTSKPTEGCVVRMVDAPPRRQVTLLMLPPEAMQDLIERGRQRRARMVSCDACGEIGHEISCCPAHPELHPAKE